MTEARYKIVFEGQLMPEQTLETVKANLARLFKSDPGKIDVLFNGAPVALKRDLSENEADKYLVALQQAGAQVRKEQDLAARLSLVDIEEEKAVSDENMECPKCGQQQPKATACSACGIIIEKFLARQAQQAQSTPGSTTVSPYSTPKSDVGDGYEEFAELKVFSVSGRIGRLRYLAWSAAMFFAFLGVYMIAAVGMAISPIIGGILTTIVVIAAMVVSIQIGVQRLHDIGWSGWLWLLMLVPLVNLAISVIMLVVPGTTDANRFGPPPPPNTTGVKVLAFSWLLFPVVIGILAAISIPAYQDYVKRAQEAQQIQQAPSGE